MNTRDPVCGMEVDPRTAAGSSEHNGQTYFFCSPQCLEQFRTAPGQYLRRPVAQSPHAPASHDERGQTVKDLVCGMMVNPATTPHQVEHQGRTYFFCGRRCVEKFQAEPDTYLHHAPEQPQLAAPQHQAATGDNYTCPMHPEVRQPGPGVCPQCGMALEPLTVAMPSARIEYTCPMHPEIVRDRPGSCPICGMALEPRTVTGEEEANPELVDMTRRFWISLVLTVPLLVLAMSEMIPGRPVQHALSTRLLTWMQFVFATPVILWSGRPFFQRGWASIVNRNLNMFTLIAIGTGTAYLYSVIATLFPNLFPPSFRTHSGEVAVYFEAAAVITTLVLLGQVLELRARSQTSSAIKALLGLAPKTARVLRGMEPKTISLWSTSSQATGSGCAQERKCRSMGSSSKGRVRWTSQW